MVAGFLIDLWSDCTIVFCLHTHLGKTHCYMGCDLVMYCCCYYDATECRAGEIKKICDMPDNSCFSVDWHYLLVYDEVDELMA